jgi:hypothetical protein
MMSGFHENLSANVTIEGIAKCLRSGASANYQGVVEGMEPPSPQPEPQQLTLFAVDSRAKITALQESAEAWLETVAHSGGRCTGSLLSTAPRGLSEKMWLASSVPTGDETSEPSSTVSFKSGMASAGLYWTANTSEWRNDGDACSLSDILEECPDPKYSLSPKACSGILRRAEKREKQIPRELYQALTLRAQEQVRRDSM